MIKRILKKAEYEKDKLFSIKESRECQKIIEKQAFPIYHIHIRKTAGTTINFAFLANSNAKDSNGFYDDLAEKRNHRLISNNKVFVGWNTDLINKGKFSYAFSHTPLHQLSLQPETFLFTCLRDPIKRVVSHYNMLRHYQIRKIDHPCMKTEGPWIGNSISDFVTLAPKHVILNQLYMFSKTFAIGETLEKLLQLNMVMFTENLKNDLKTLEELTKWKLPISNQKSYGHKEDISDSQLERLRELLDPEYVLIDKFKTYQSNLK